MTCYDRKVSAIRGVVNSSLGVFEVDFSSYDPSVPLLVDDFAPYDRYGGTQSSPHSAGLKPPPRPTTLTNETLRLYDAVSFLTWKTGLCFNSHITITAKTMGFSTDVEFTRALTRWNKEMNRCLFNGERKLANADSVTNSRRYNRQSKHTVGHAHYWIWVVEHARDQGLHVHQLCVVPREVQSSFEVKTWDWWVRNSPSRPDANAIDFRTRHPRALHAQFERQVELFRYIIKTTKASLTVRDRQGEIWPIGRIFRPYPNECSPVFVRLPQLAGISHRLNLGVQKADGFFSRYQTGQFEDIYTGWEHGAFLEREQRLRSRALAATLAACRV